MIEMIQYNTKAILKTMFVVASTLFSILSFVLCIMTWEELETLIKLSKLWTIVLIVLVSMIAAILWVCVLRKKNTVFEKGKKTIQICYGDVIKLGFSKRHKKIVVIPVNTSFDTIVDEDIARIEKPLVSANTLHGKWILGMEMHKIGREDLDREIKTCLKQEPVVKALAREVKTRGNLEHYAISTIVPFAWEKNTIFLLVALSEFDKDNKAESEEEHVVKCAQSILDFYNRKGQGYDIYVPLMGTGRSDAGLSHKDSLRILKSFFLLNGKRLRGNLHIVIYNGDKKHVSIFD